MTEITLILVVFFTLYNGIESKIKHKKVIQFNKWIDSKSRLLIKNFAFKSNRELFNYLYNKNRKLFIFLLVITFAFLKLDFLAFPISLIFIISMILNAILISKEDFKKEVKNSAKIWGFGILSTTILIFLAWFYKDSKEYEPIRQVGYIFKKQFEEGADMLGIGLTTYVLLLLFGILLLATIYFFVGLVLRGVVWLLLLILKCYTKLCFSLNKRQPLKPFYLLSKTIIIIISYIIAKITTPI